MFFPSIVFLCAAALIPTCNGAVPGAQVVLPLKGKFFEEYMFFAPATIGAAPGAPTALVFDTGSSDLLIPVTGCAGCQPPGSYTPSPNSARNVSIAEANRLGFVCSNVPGSSPEDTCRGTTDYGGTINEYWWLTADYVSFPGTALGEGSGLRSYLGAVYNISFSASAGAHPGLRVRSAVRDRGLAASRPGLVTRLAAQKQGSGMWGAAFSSIAAAREPTLMDAMLADLSAYPMFSVCLGADGGSLGVGGYLPGMAREVNQGNFTSIAVVAEDFWSVRFLDVYVGSTSIGVAPSVYNALHAIVDTGTPNPNLPTAAWKVLASHFASLCSEQAYYNLPGLCSSGVPVSPSLFDQGCFNLTAADIAMYPTVSFVMEGAVQGTNATVPYPPARYLTPQYYCNPGEYGLGMADGGAWSVLGAQGMLDMGFAFDSQRRAIDVTPVC